MRALVFVGVLIVSLIALGLVRTLVLRPAGFTAQSTGALMAAGGLISFGLAGLAASGQRRRTSISTGRPEGERTASSPSNTP